MEIVYIKFLTEADRVQGVYVLINHSRVDSLPDQVYQVAIEALKLLDDRQIAYRRATGVEVQDALARIRKPGDPPSEKLQNVMLVLVGVPMLGVLMGGIYSLPAMCITRCRDPWYTLLLALGLSVTVVGVGLATGLPWPLIAGAWMCACVLLFTRRCFGKLDDNLERFGFVHSLTFFGMMWLSILPG
jgi:hypothetical protein